MKYSFCGSAHGPLLIAIDRDGLRYVEFVRGEQPVTPTAEWQQDDLALAPFVEQFAAYFSGRLQQFDLPLAAVARHSSRRYGAPSVTSPTAKPSATSRLPKPSAIPNRSELLAPPMAAIRSAS